MLDKILENIIVTLICSALVFVLKSAYNFIKNAECEPYHPGKFTPKKTVQKQFFYSFFVFVFSISGAWALKLGVLKIFLMIFSLFSFLFTWGAFDVVFSFYPETDPRETKPAQNAPEQSRKD